MARQINQEGLNLIKQWEGKKLIAYKDSGGVLTVGYGHTSAAGAPKVVSGMKITEAEAESILRADLSKFEKRVNDLVKVKLTDNQFAALVSFDFNTGALHKSTLLKKLNAGDYNAVPKELMKWVNDNGKKVEGLVNRRAAECGLWAKGAFVSSNNVPVQKEKEPIVTKETISWATGILSTLGIANAGNGPIQWALGAILVIAFGVGLYFFIKKRTEK